MKCSSKVLWVALCTSVLVNVVVIFSPYLRWHMHSSCCATDSGIYGDGKLISQNYSFADYPFDEIQLKVAGEMEVRVTHQPHAADASITVDRNLLQYIDLYVRGKTLYIARRGDVDFSSNAKVKIIVNADNLKSVVTYGSGNSIINNIDTDYFSSKIHGSGSTVLQGKTKKLSLGIHGSGDIDAKNLTSDDVKASIYGSGNIFINATKKISANIHGSGTIDYYGTPAKVDFSGGGKIRSVGR